MKEKFLIRKNELIKTLSHKISVTPKDYRIFEE